MKIREILKRREQIGLSLETKLSDETWTFSVGLVIQKTSRAVR